MSRSIGLGGALVLAVAAAAQASPQATGPAFDCSKATGQIETLICKDEGLAALDRRMADVFAKAMKSWPAGIASEQRSFQRGWIKGRNDCWKDDDPRACTEREYKSRIVELQIKSGQLMAPKAVGYDCTGGENKPFTAAFYQEADPPSAVLTYGNDQVIAFIAESGSGARYTAANVEFWEHQGEATVSWFGTELKCNPIKAPAKGDATMDRKPLGGTSWVLMQFQSMDDTTLKPEEGRHFGLTFAEDGSLQVLADCNRGRGTWTSADNVTLEIGPVALTRAMCPPSRLERFTRDLGYVRSYVMKDGHLFLSLMADGGIYEFAPDTPAR